METTQPFPNPDDVPELATNPSLPVPDAPYDNGKAAAPVATRPQVAVPRFTRPRLTRRNLFIGGGALLAVLLIVGAVLYRINAAKIGALLAANDFCNAVKAQQYPTAYSYFAPSLRGQVPQDAFLTISHKGDQLQGVVTNCAVKGVDVGMGGQAVTIHSVVTRSITGGQATDLHLSSIGGKWKITSSPDPLLLSLTTAYEFCQSVVRQDYPAAYGYFAPGIQGQVPQAAFTFVLSGSDALNGKVTDCTVTGVDHDVTYQHVTVHSSLVRQAPQPTDLQLALIQNHWKITASPDPLLIPSAVAYAFCENLKGQHYPAAYGALTPDLQRAVPQDAFVTILQGADGLQGQVQACNVTDVALSKDGKALTVHSTLVRAKQSAPSTLHLVLLGDQWRIDQSPDPLLLPLTAAYEFCQDLKAQQYKAAYGYFSGGFQDQISLDAFLYISQGGDALQGRVQACNVTGVAINSAVTIVTVQSTVVRTGLTEGTMVQLGLIDGAWRITASPDPLLLPLTTAYYFCQDLQAQRYSHAYRFLSAGVQGQIPGDAFVYILNTADALQGRLKACNVNSVALSDDGAAVTVASTLVRATLGNEATTLHIGLTDNGWRITASPDPLLLPSVTGYEFCQALVRQDNGTAFSLMSARAQTKLGNATNLQITLGIDELLTGAPTGCTVDSIAFGDGGTSLTIKSTTTFAKFDPVPTEVDEVLEGDKWRVDNLILTIYTIPIAVPGK